MGPRGILEKHKRRKVIKDEIKDLDAKAGASVF